MMENEIAGEGQVFVCSACGKRSKDRYGLKKIDHGWDESCMLKAFLCDSSTLVVDDASGRVTKANAAGIYRIQ